MRITFSLIVILCLGQLPTACSAQQLYNNYADVSSSPAKEVYELWQNYSGGKPNTRAAARLWDNDEAKSGRAYDILRNWECGGTVAERSYLLKISKIDSGIFAIKMALVFANDTNDFGIVSNITYLAKQEKRGLKLANYLYYSTRNWRKFSTKSITFYYPTDFHMNNLDAQKSERFMNKIYTTLKLDPRPISYYATPTCEQMQLAIGMDAYVGNTPANTCSCMDTANTIIFSGGKGFYDPQDLVRVAGSYFPRSHPIFMTGLTGLFGGWNGKNMASIQQQFLAYVNQNPDFQIKDLTSFHEVNSEINPQYLVGAAFCAASLKAGGVEKLKKLMAYGTKDADFYIALYKELNIPREKAKDYFLTLLKDPTLFAQYPDF